MAGLTDCLPKRQATQARNSGWLVHVPAMNACHRPCSCRKLTRVHGHDKTVIRVSIGSGDDHHTGGDGARYHGIAMMEDLGDLFEKLSNGDKQFSVTAGAAHALGTCAAARPSGMRRRRS